MKRQTLSEIKGGSAMLWSRRVGRMHWRNNILVQGDRVFFSTSGDSWNKPDSRDGVGCVDIESGDLLWLCPTQSDANEIAAIDGTLVVGTDAGTILAIDADTGGIRQKFQTAGPVYARATQLDGPGYPGLIVASYSGEIVRYDPSTSTFTAIGKVPFSIRANLAPLVDPKGTSSFLVGAEDGSVLHAKLSETSLSWKPIFQVQPHLSHGPYHYQLEIKGISSIVTDGDLAIVSYVRDTYDAIPPMLSFSIATGRKIWDAGRARRSSDESASEFGNSRITPAIWRDSVISTFAYNDSVHAFSKKTGEWLWHVRLDEGRFQNWSSPMVKGNRLFVARINGVLSIVDLNSRKILSSYSVEIFDDTEHDNAPLLDEPWPSVDLALELPGPGPGQPLTAGICSTPAVSGNKVLVGTVSGQLCCIRF